MAGSHRRNLTDVLHTPSPGSQDPDSPLPPIFNNNHNNPGPIYPPPGSAASDDDASHLFDALITEIMEEQEAVSLSSTFPNPPSFWRDFTPDKIARYEQLRNEHDEGEANGRTTGDEGYRPQTRIENLPEELTYLQPPAEPTDGRWRVFGDQYMLNDQLPTLQEQGITNLPATGQSSARDAKHYDRAFELKRLSKSLLLNFLELTGALSRSPSQAEAKVEDLRTLFINVHHILNEYRPHQARESAIEMMQDHLDRTRTETLAIRTQVDKAKRLLEGLGSLSLGGDGATQQQRPAERKQQQAAEGKGGADGIDWEMERRIWASVDDLFS
ncbi:Mediator complex, subunit Med7 [Cordyceps fumosorosea ARSEF 2679]|uniref:Mediator of RNA polymerase II transcription subunit 7 n=1 Tax=Cordyceps fumosorosea (strain ARSEF 2679) TaxID=1081104 RepID=A0A162LEW4_CORFA|nr:Mediator complex, subunit Med7 [Cordyceps fumosorosea ARSEF 2679]OAA69664.1 Mediator complex, subunit Med7 [Cordyceps fumosorosea ARSEF 2679]